MSQARLILIRHAQASFGTDDYDRLSPLGHQQAAWLGEYFQSHSIRIDRALRGSLRRQRETAQALARAGVCPDPIEDPRLNEMHYDEIQGAYVARRGNWPVESREDYLRVFPEMLADWAADDLGPGIESYGSFIDRIMAAKADAVRAEGVTALVTSAGVIGGILSRILDLPLRSTAAMMLNIRNASVHELVHEGGLWRLSQFNAAPHLDPPDRAHARTYI